VPLGELAGLRREVEIRHRQQLSGTARRHVWLDPNVVPRHLGSPPGLPG
jgi:hypothetical protein